MGFVTGIWLAVLGVLGAASLIIAKKPDAKELIDKLTPYQGWIGAGSAVWGLWGVISSVLGIGLLAHAPFGGSRGSVRARSRCSSDSCSVSVSSKASSK